MKLKTTLTAVLLASIAGLALADDSMLWVEGEQPTATAHVTQNTGLNNINPFVLSAGGWLSSFSEAGNPDTGTADYGVNVPAAGEYRFWLRAVAGTGIFYRVDGGSWTVVEGGKGIKKECSAADGGFGWPPMIAWFDLGKLTLGAGKHTISFQLGGSKPGGSHFAAIDCFVLTTGEFLPNGRYKPGEKAPEPTADIPDRQGWDFTPPTDALSSNAVLDLRYLNEKVAGEHGFIALSKDGNSFVRGDGEAIRFWGTGVSTDAAFEKMKHHAQFLAKRGVNVIRLHVILAPRKEGSSVNDVDESTLDYVFSTVAAMKSAGIYSIISPYWGDHVTIRKSWGLLAEGGEASGQLYFEPSVQNAYKSWVKTLYTRVNPYTNVRLADEPAVAIIQYQNENSLLWWNTSKFSGKVFDLFRQRYARFLIAKYGSFEKVRAAWQDYNPPAGELTYPSDWEKGLPGIPHIWDLSRDGTAKKSAYPGFTRCSGDFTEFLSRTMYDFNTDMAAYLRHDLGCKQLINSDNWRGPDGLTQDAQYWSETAVDVVAKNAYTGGYHKGINDGWQVLAGAYFSSPSIIQEPVSLPCNFKQPVGHPTMVPETSWTHPGLYQSEGPLMMAAQSDLNGLDLGSWFCSDAVEWMNNPQTKWSDNTPMLLGQFPANALIFRQGLVRAGEPAVVEQRPLADVFDRKVPLIYDEVGFDDPNHSAGVSLSSQATSWVDQLAYLVGPVQVVYGGDPAKTKIVDLSKYIDRPHQIVHSITGEITTDYGRGLYRVDSPRAQAVAGFLGQVGPQALSDVTIDCRNHYATVCVVPMDEQPIKSSGKVLIQIGTICRATGWLTEPATLFRNKKPFECQKIVNVGKMPWRVENADVKITVANPKLTNATLLDLNGMATDTAVRVENAGGKVTVTVPPNTMYLVLSEGK